MKTKENQVISTEEMEKTTEKLASPDRKRRFDEAFTDNDKSNNKEGPLAKKYKKEDENESPNHNHNIVLKPYLNSEGKDSEKCILNLNSNDIKIYTETFEKYKNKDIFVNYQQLYNLICKCSTCQDMYNSLKVGFLADTNFCSDWNSRTLMEDKLNKEANEETVENNQLIENIENVDFMNIGSVKNLPVEKVYIYI